MSAMDKIHQDYRYSAEHEWVDSSSPAKVGLSQIAVDALGDVVYVDVPEVGATVTAGQVCGEVESTKSVSEIYAPVTGVVAEVNDAVIDDPALLNADPYGQAWLFTVNVEAEGDLLTPEQYAAAQDDDA